MGFTKEECYHNRFIGIPTILPNHNGIIGDLMGLDGINRGGVIINHDGDIIRQWDI